MTLDVRDDLEVGLEGTRSRIAAAAHACGRDAGEVTLIVVTKTWPASHVRHLARLGVRDFGENRDQEARTKAEACADLDINWHFVGQLQRNKASSVVRYADFVHSVDRVPLCRALDSAAAKAGRRIKVFAQVNLQAGPQSDRTGRGGANADDLERVCAAVRSAQHLDLIGLMAVPPLGQDPADAYERLAVLRQSVLRDFPEAACLSAGMSSDIELAIRAGATHVRVGTAVCGYRENVR
ncbi:MAG: YggS family pyridoxal phosphate-dependent enzyme [Candidatus Nanopelagicales bacterium]|nr:YggS family pyridoxal phosphate-dependent enzyme [Candidatus Nanopelagicales bacterium]